MKSYFAYTRVSTAKQGEHGSSLPEQKSAIEAYAARHGLQIARWYEERETAAKLGRRVFSKMLRDLDREHVAGLIVHKVDRSARNLSDWNVIGELIDRGIEVHFAHESLDLASRSGRLSADLLAVIAADYVRNLREEVRKGMRGRLKQGLYPLRAPIGYLDRGRAKAKEIDPFKGPLIRQMFELYASGHFGLHGLRHEMQRRGLSRPSGQPLSKNGVSVILRNPFYTGVIRIRRSGETFAGVHRPVVSKGLFDAVQARLDGRTYAHVVKHTFAYRRLLKCAQCSRSLTGERQKGHAYYRCHTPTCRRTSVLESDVDLRLATAVAFLDFTEGDLTQLRALAVDLDTDANREEELRGQLKRALGLCEDRLTRLTDAFLDGAIDRETFNARNAQLVAERQDLNRRLADRKPTDQATRLVKKFELGNTALQSLHSPIPDEKRDAVEILTSNLVVHGKSVGITLRFPFDEVEKWRTVPSSDHYWTGLRTKRHFRRQEELGRLQELLQRLVSEDGTS